jgi:hypothetical protein
VLYRVGNCVNLCQFEEGLLLVSPGVGGACGRASPWGFPHPWKPVEWPDSQGAEMCPSMQ